MDTRRLSERPESHWAMASSISRWVSYCALRKAFEKLLTEAEIAVVEAQLIAAYGIDRLPAQVDGIVGAVALRDGQGFILRDEESAVQDKAGTDALFVRLEDVDESLVAQVAMRPDIGWDRFGEGTGRLRIIGKADGNHFPWRKGDVDRIGIFALEYIRKHALDLLLDEGGYGNLYTLYSNLQIIERSGQSDRIGDRLRVRDVLVSDKIGNQYHIGCRHHIGEGRIGGDHHAISGPRYKGKISRSTGA